MQLHGAKECQHNILFCHYKYNIVQYGGLSCREGSWLIYWFIDWPVDA
jgi:hypothetical protein